MDKACQRRCPFIKSNNEQCKLMGTVFCRYHSNYGDCGICFENVSFRQKHVTKCAHLFHKNCINRWLLQKKQCPICREKCDTGLPIVRDYLRVLKYRPSYIPIFIVEFSQPHDLQITNSQYLEVFDGEMYVPVPSFFGEEVSQYELRPYML